MFATSVLSGEVPLVDLCALNTENNIDKIRAILMYAMGQNAAASMLFTATGAAISKKDFCDAYRHLKVELRDESRRQVLMRRLKLIFTGPVREAVAKIGIPVVGYVAFMNHLLKYTPSPEVQGLERQLGIVTKPSGPLRKGIAIIMTLAVFLMLSEFLHTLAPRFQTKLDQAIRARQKRDDEFGRELLGAVGAYVARVRARVPRTPSSESLADLRAKHLDTVPAYVFARPNGKLRGKNETLAYLQAFRESRVPEY